MYRFLTPMLLLQFSLVQAQFTRVIVNEDALPGAPAQPFRACGQNEFVTLVNGELFHLVMQPDSSFRSSRIAGAPDKLNNLHLFDFNLDGRLDLFAWRNDGLAYYYFEKQNGRFEHLPQHNRGASSAYIMATDDFDGDGKPEYLLDHQVYHMTAPYEFELIFRYAVGNDLPYNNGYLTDADRDGDTDILYHLNTIARVVVNNGNDFSTHTIIKPGPNELAWLRMLRTGTGDAYLYYDGTIDSIMQLTFSQDSAITSPLLQIPSVNPVQVYDINRDGTEELILADNNKLIILQYNEQLSTVDTLEIVHTNTIHGVGCMQDASQDVLMMIADLNSITTYKVDTDFAFTLRRTQLTNITTTNTQFIDIDGDEDVDVIQPGKFRRYTSTFSFDNTASITLPDPIGVFEDVNDDGHVDFVSGEFYYPNLGDMTFGFSEDYPAPVPVLGNTNEVLRVDLDQDGDTDIITYKHFQNLSVLYNTNNEYYEDPVDLDPNGVIRFDEVYTTTSDLNRDGRLDIVIATQRGLFYVLATGPVTFAAPVVLQGSINNVTSADVADYNADNYPDVLLTNTTSNTGMVRLYKGSASGFMSASFSVTSAVVAAFAEMDGSGFRDIVYAYSRGLWYATTSDGSSFEHYQLDTRSVSNPRILSNDVNADGKQDVIVFTADGNAIYYYLAGFRGKPGNACPGQGVTCYNQDNVNQYGFEYGHCTAIPGDLVLDWIYVQGKKSTIKDLSPFSNLQSIGGNLDVSYLDSVPDLSGFGQLEHVGGHFSLSFSEINIEGMSGLRSVGGDFSLYSVHYDDTFIPTGHFTALDTIGGSILINRTDIQDLTGLLQPIIRGNIELIDMRLQNTFGFEMIDTITGQLRLLRTNISSLDELHNLRYVHSINVYETPLQSAEILKDMTHMDGSLELWGPGLELHQGFRSLQSIAGSIELEAEYCASLHALDSIGGRAFLRTYQMDELAFANLRHLGSDLNILVYNGPDFNRFSKLDTIYGDLQIAATYVEAIDGFDSLRHIGGNLIFSNNQKLQSIRGLPDSITIGDLLRIYNNPKLRYCDEPFVCNHIAAGKGYDFHSNGSDCSDVSHIRCVDNQFSGTVFHDYNQNLIRDNNEALLANIHMQLSPPGQTVITSTNGYYAVTARPGDAIQVRTTIPADWSATGNTEFVVDSFIPGLSTNAGNDIGLVPNFTRRDVRFTFSTGNVICNIPFDAHLRMENTGTEPEVLTIDYYYPDHAVVDPGFQDFELHDEELNLLRFRLDTLHPFFSTVIDVPMIAGPIEFENQMFSQAVEIYATRDQGQELIESYESNLALLCAYDPNDKQVTSSNGSQDIHVNTDDALMYTIRFQNTGNYPATHVRLIDTLSEHLDIATFTFTGSSHPVEIHKYGNLLVFYFYDIMLPDSSTDLKGSQGYVTFTIQPFSGIALGEEINNQVDIYFDFNAPIATNRVQSVVVEITPVNVVPLAPSVSLYPNPVQEKIHLSSVDAQLDGASYSIHTPQGLLVRSGTVTEGTIDVSMISKGIYFLTLKLPGERLSSLRFVRM